MADPVANPAPGTRCAHAHGLVLLPGSDSYVIRSAFADPRRRTVQNSVMLARAISACSNCVSDVMNASRSRRKV